MLEVGNFDVGISRKLAPKFTGPFRLTDISSPLNCKIQALDGSSGELKVLVRRLRPFADRDIRLNLSSEPLFALPSIAPPAIPINKNSTSLPDFVAEPDYNFPDSMEPDQTQESIQKHGFRTRSGRMVRPPIKF